jgi:thioredoxin-like negative regulator of GroEL
MKTNTEVRNPNAERNPNPEVRNGHARRVLQFRPSWIRNAVFWKTLAIVVSTAFATTALAELPAGWSTNFSATLSDAATNRRPTLVFFTASWCGPCKLMVRTTLTNDAVMRALGAFNCVAVDIDEQGPLARVHEISAVPTFKVLTPAGEAVDDETGFQSPEAFVAWLTNAGNSFSVKLARREEANRKLAEAETLFAKADLNSLSNSVSLLLDLCAQRQGEVTQTAVARLAAVCTRQPALLLPGLEHPKLAARIQAANLLRAKLGETFEADPWADAVTRQKIVAQWREKLTGQ